MRLRSSRRASTASVLRSPSTGRMSTGPATTGEPSRAAESSSAPSAAAAVCRTSSRAMHRLPAGLKLTDGAPSLLHAGPLPALQHRQRQPARPRVVPGQRMRRRRYRSLHRVHRSTTLGSEGTRLVVATEEKLLFDREAIELANWRNQMPSQTTYLDVTEAAGRALFMRRITGPVVMLNVLRFRAQADYSATPHLAPREPIDGATRVRAVHGAHASRFCGGPEVT